MLRFLFFLCCDVGMLLGAGALPQREQGPAAAPSCVSGGTWCARPARDACVWRACACVRL